MYTRLIIHRDDTPGRLDSIAYRDDACAQGCLDFTTYSDGTQVVRMSCLDYTAIARIHTSHLIVRIHQDVWIR